MIPREQWLNRVLPASRTLGLPVLTTVGLVTAYLVMRARVLPLLMSDPVMGPDRPIWFLELPRVWRIRLWAIESADTIAVLAVVIGLGSLLYARRQPETARRALHRGLFNTVNVMLVVSVAFLIVGAQRAAVWRVNVLDDSYSVIRVRLGKLGADARCDALTRILVHRVKEGELDTSYDYARALVESMPQCERTYADYGFAMATAHQVIGYAALKRKNTPVALKALEAAGDAPASPSLTARGPGTGLALELLRVGERDAVLQYLEKMRMQWPKGERQISRWTRLVRRGVIPQNFGWS